MPFNNIVQPDIIEIDENLRLRKTDESENETALPWYQNPMVLYYSEGMTEGNYDLNVICRMYKFLGTMGELYFIEALEDGAWKPIGDATLSDRNMPIAIGDERYWGKGIGKKVIGKLLDRAREIGMDRIFIPAIYKYNERSRNLFTSFGFVKVAENEKEDSFELRLK
jgi:RimJ/RimL family protein N-acetyltransferase